ncbi:polysialyltransferase family glycosyltransferase [Clostridium botulinum]|uniref:Exopolysaccharide biosynthesis protein n=1 Tax=Clostridium botulinum (strain Langeland / NCTC 10281 / Type F) TaxID=441772 RepID=A7GGS1_CLOBL|nr:polysialyltransferase family glycosyltransferase [Clostridium botulinum]ABS39860.1 exopolysaccharide biosynthesis protein [Clostridium botulinum F str. Langeland]ADG00375.1 exopolysaccharide biosynthesis protein [Clostridium botulinum F str. 230613]KKM41134.1 exopolysaccharide biosynthesis protein [Clostridium botulinum]MBY6793811.1 exopolysaccharide biosynthesis protein [Clostridium botulinum]MBY6937672.1 exopolysaccharide biosynthesis protein [Clostridium botulinum]
MNLYVCSTPYHLFVTLCDIANKDVKSYIYLSTPDYNVFRMFLKYKEKLSIFKNIEKVWVRKRNNLYERLFIEEIKDELEYKRLKKIIISSNVIIFPWNPYSLFSPSEYIFKYAKKVRLIEDGANLYVMRRPSRLSRLVKKYIYRRDLEFYRDEKITEVMVQFPEKYPKHLKDKLVYLDLNSMVNKINSDVQKNIVNIFVDKLNMYDFKNKSLLILSQPLSEDGYITEEEKIELYKHIIDTHGQDYNIILKRHPREKTIYNFPQALELDGNFPSEVFKLLDIKFEKAIGICTGAIKFVDAKEAFNIDEDFLKKCKVKK